MIFFKNSQKLAKLEQLLKEERSRYEKLKKNCDQQLEKERARYERLKKNRDSLQLRLTPSQIADESIPDHHLYKTHFRRWLYFHPWEGEEGFEEFYKAGEKQTLVSRECSYVLYILSRQALALNGELWECGVYKGGTALMFDHMIRSLNKNNHAKLRLFDTFEGMPETKPGVDLHKKGDFIDTSLESVRERFANSNHIEFHKGMIPESFSGLENTRIAFAHIDVDIFQSVYDCCEFIYKRLCPGGFMVFDDYGQVSCPGARKAVDEFFEDKPEIPLTLLNGQAVVIRVH